MPHVISLQQAAAMTLRYRQNKESILKTEFQNENLLPLSETFEKAAVEMLLAQTGCTAIRIYYGMDERLRLHAILVGCNASNADILPEAVAVETTADDDGVIIDNAIRCPPLCPESGPLNEP